MSNYTTCSITVAASAVASASAASGITATPLWDKDKKAATTAASSRRCESALANTADSMR